MPDLVDPIHRTEIDGVPLLWADVPAPRRLGIAFRVGRADETLANGGITHLVEHLALRLGHQLYTYNGTVEGARTILVAAGEDDELAVFLQRAVKGLNDLPTEGLVSERRILETEASSRKPGTVELLLNARFGARGHGLAAYAEYGFRWLTIEDVRAWALRWFVRENATIWVTGPPPANLRCELPAGQRGSGPSVEAVDFRLPAWMPRQSGGIAVGFLGTRSSTLTLLLRLIDKHVRERLRFRESIAYDIRVHYLRLNSDAVHVAVLADSLPEHASAALRGLVEVFDQLAAEGPTVEEIADEVLIARRAFGEPTHGLSRLDSAVFNLLFAATDPTTSMMLSELEELRPRDLATEMESLLASAILVGPADAWMSDSRFHPMPEWSSASVEGQVIQPVTGTPDDPQRTARLIVGPAGITHAYDDRRIVTVFFSRIAALMRWNDGSRTIWGEDGARIDLRAGIWKRRDWLVATVDAGVPPGRVIPMGDRAPAISVAPPQADPTMAWVRLAVVIAVIVVLGGVLNIVQGQITPQSLGAVIVFFGLAVGGALGLVVRWRRRARRGRGPDLSPNSEALSSDR